MASHLEDPEAKAAMLKIADEYERLATRSAERMNKKNAMPDTAERKDKDKRQSDP